MGRASLLLVLGASVVFTVMNLQLNKAAERSAQNLVEYFEHSMAGAIGNQAAQYLLSELADSSSWRVRSQESLSSDIIGLDGDYAVHYTITDIEKDVRGAERDLIRLRIQTRYGRSLDTILVFIDPEFGFVPSSVRAAVTSFGSLSRTVGDMQIDGRDHSRSGSLDPTEPGVFGISTGPGFSNRDKARVGGTDSDGNARPVKYPPDPGIIETNSAARPSSPDEAVGFADGTLKSLAQSGVGGSQYVDDPLELRFPLSGITYVELPAGVAWRGPNLSDSEGLLVVHNSAVNARLENANTRDEEFRGLIIADYMFHIHMDVVGAIVLLSPTLEKVKECNGNEDHRILFSTRAVKRSTKYLLKNGAGWQGRVPIVAWRD